MLKRTSKTRFLFFLASDIFFIVASIYLSFFIRYDFSIPPQYLHSIPYYCAIALGALIPIFYIKRLYHFTWIYVGISDLIRIFQAVTYGFFLLGLFLFLGRNHYLTENLPRSIILIDLVLVFFFVGGIRFAKRLSVEILKKSGSQRGGVQKPKIIIIGAGDTAEQLIRSMKQSTYPFSVIGLLDDGDLKQETSIHDVRVLGKISELPHIHKKIQLHGIIIAFPSASSSQIKKIVAIAQSCGISYIKIIPSLNTLIERRVTIADVRDLNMEDLLGRQKIDVSFKEIEQFINGKKILVTGAAGSIGFELVKQLSRLSPKMLICVDSDETGIFTVERFFTVRSELSTSYVTRVANILNKTKMRTLFVTYRPDIVFHAAAYKHVRIMERESDEAVLNNILGSWNVVDAARECGAKNFIFVSTDKAVRPNSVMGMSKRVAELLTLAYNGEMRCVAVRFGNVLGSRGSVVPLFKEQILSGGPVTVTHPDMERYFMVPSEAILLVLQAAAISAGEEILVLDMGRPVKILQLAETMIKLAGFEPYKDIPIIFTSPAQGEKFFEEILSNKENMSTTKHESIFIAPSTPLFDRTHFFTMVEELINEAKSGSTATLHDKLVKLIVDLE